MPTIRLQYDLRATHIDNNIPGVSHGRVYNLISQQLTVRNWNRHQNSKWYKTLITFLAASAEADQVCQAVEALCGLAPNPPAPNHIFHRVEIEEQVNHGQIRP